MSRFPSKKKEAVVKAVAVLMLGLSVLGCVDAGASPLELRGPTDADMLAKVQAAFMQGKHDFVIDSRGGRESIALRIAAVFAKAHANITVRGACTSACAQYLLPAASSVTIEDGAFVAFHLNSSGILASGDIAGAGLEAEIRANDSAARQLYASRGVRSGFLLDSTRAVRPTCMTLGARSRLFTAFDYWVPDRATLRENGLNWKGYWPATEAEALAPAKTLDGRRLAVTFGPAAADSSRAVVPLCPAQ